MKKSTWTEKELKYLVKHWHKDSNSEIARKINKTESSVRQKAEKIVTFDMMKKRKYSKYEDELLRNLYGTMPIEELSNRMKRSIASLKKRIYVLEGTADYTVLQDVYSTIEIAGFLGIDDSTLRDRLASSDMPFYKIKNKNVIKHDDFWNWLKVNLDKPNYRTIKSEYELLAPKWYSDVIIKKKRELSSNNQGKPWNSIDEALVWSEMLKGTPYSEIAKMLKRSVYSIQHKVKCLSKKRMSKVS